MNLRRYGRNNDDLLIEIECDCRELFTFLAKYKQEQLQNEPITCPECKTGTTVKALLPSKFFYQMKQNQQQHQFIDLIMQIDEAHRNVCSLPSLPGFEKERHNIIDIANHLIQAIKKIKQIEDRQIDKRTTTLLAGIDKHP